MRKVCAELRDWLVEINHPAQHAVVVPKIQVVFQSDGDAQLARREWLYRSMDALRFDEMGRGRMATEGVDFEFVGPEITIRR